MKDILIFSYHKSTRNVWGIFGVAAGAILIWFTTKQLIESGAKFDNIVVFVLVWWFFLESLKDLLFPSIWTLKISKDRISWQQPEKVGPSKTLIFSELKRGLFSSKEKNIVIFDRSEECFTIPTQCYSKTNEVIDAIRTAAPSFELIGD